MIMCFTTSFHFNKAANLISKVRAIEVQNKVEKKKRWLRCSQRHGVTKRCRLSWLTNSGLVKVIEAKFGVGGLRLWSSNSIVKGFADCSQKGTNIVSLVPPPPPPPQTSPFYLFHSIKTQFSLFRKEASQYW